MRKVIAVAAASAIERGGRRVSAVGLQILVVLAVFGNQKLIQNISESVLREESESSKSD